MARTKGNEWECFFPLFPSFTIGSYPTHESLLAVCKNGESMILISPKWVFLSQIKTIGPLQRCTGYRADETDAMVLTAL